VNFRIAKHLVWILMLLGAADGQAAGDVCFQAGVAAYEAGRYEPAAQAFRGSLAQHPAAGTLLNLGLAEWQSGHPGEAMLAWEQAAWLDPFRSAARDNLLFARETTGVNPPDLTWFELASTWLPANFWTWLAGGSLWLAVAMVTVPGFLRVSKAGWHQTTAAVALGVFLLSIPPSIGVVTRSNIGIVVDKNTSLRLTPTQAAEVVASLPAGEPVRRLRIHGDYLLVRTQNGNGWVERRQIRFVCPR
jgi:tetratricopeptide (TPR) repeat protein